MKRKTIEFHKLRYTPNLRKIPRFSRTCVKRLYAEVDQRRNHGGKEAFLRWFAENKTALESPLFKSFYDARQEQEKTKRIFYHNLHAISEHYALSLKLLGCWFTILNESNCLCEKTIGLARTFLLEIAIFDAQFAGVYDSALASLEFREWKEKNHRILDDYMEIGLNDRWLQKMCGDEFVVQAKSHVSHDALSPDQINLKREEQHRLSQPGHDLQFDYDRSAIIQDYIAQNIRLNEYPHLSLEGIKNTLKKWDNAGRHIGWQPLTVRQLQETERLITLVHQGMAKNRTQEDEDFAEILWTQGEQFWQHQRC